MLPRNHTAFHHMIYCFDIDGTLCHTVSDGNYRNAVPIEKAIQEVNRLYDDGNTIVLFTARGASSGIDWEDVTKEQISRWGLRHHRLICRGKPTFDVLVDDKAINAQDWRKTISPIRGVIAGAFDLIHPGYCRMMEFCKRNCDHLTVLLHDDPSVERTKIRPVHTVDERKEILLSIRHVDAVVEYRTEEELESILKTGQFSVRFLGDDYNNKNYTGKQLNLPVIFVSRNHTYSTTALKRAVAHSYQEYMKGSL